MNELSTTEHGLPIDLSHANPATEESLQRAAAALRQHGMSVEIVDSVAQARDAVIGLLPHDKSILTASSETLRESGITKEVEESGRFRSTRGAMAQLDYATQSEEIRLLGAAPDVVVGSVHAVTEDGRVLVASMTGSQLGPYVSGAARVIWVVGAQKVVPDLATAMNRIEHYSYPREDGRARATYGVPSSINKILIVNGEANPFRVTVVLIREVIGF